jgi:hypothetical protein
MRYKKSPWQWHLKIYLNVVVELLVLYRTVGGLAIRWSVIWNALTLVQKHTWSRNLIHKIGRGWYRAIIECFLTNIICAVNEFSRLILINAIIDVSKIMTIDAINVVPKLRWYDEYIIGVVWEQSDYKASLLIVFYGVVANQPNYKASMTWEQSDWMIMRLHRQDCTIPTPSWRA